MRHRKHTEKLGRTGGHRKSLRANMLKALIQHNRIVTSQAKAKFIKRYADQMVTLAKNNSLASRRQAMSQLMIRFNRLTPKEARAAKKGDVSAYNDDRMIIQKLFEDLGPRFSNRQGGYTRLIKTPAWRRGDGSTKCIIEFLPNESAHPS